LTRWLNFFAWAVLAYAPPFPHVMIAHNLTIEEQIIKTAWEKQVSPDLALRLAWEESHFNPGVSRKERNGSASWGPLQLNDRYFINAAKMTPKQNIEAGLGHFASLLHRCRGSARCAVRAYRSGVVRRD